MGTTTVGVTVMSEIEIGRAYEVESLEAYEDLVGPTSLVVDEIRVENEVDDETVRVHQLDLARGEGQHQDVQRDALERLLAGGYLEVAN